MSSQYMDMTAAAAESSSWDRLDPSDPVVVIGAGIVGVSAAYHLLRSGARDVTVVDRNEPGGGTTAAGAGFVALWAAGMGDFGAAGLALEQYSLDFYRRLHEEGHEISYRNDGNLVLAVTRERYEQYVQVLVDHPFASPGTRAISAAEVAERTGVVDASAVAGGVLMPSGIQLETGQAVTAVAGLVETMGGRVLTDATVEGLVRDGEQVTAVRTTAGDLPAAAVVVAAGAWTNRILAHLDVRLPLLPFVATRIVTEVCGVPDSMPTIQCREFPLWLRESGGGLTFGTSAGYRAAFQLAPPGGSLPFGRPRKPELFDAVRAHSHVLDRVFPGISELPVKSWLQGMPVYTPDGQLVIGRVPGCPNAIVLGGDNETGVSHGPAMGRAGAQLVRGDTSFTDLASFRPDRFDPAEFPDDTSMYEHLEGVVWKTRPWPPAEAEPTTR
ncbi:NAD(P)/FAD-dependent oxidoreductase [Streptomyces sp. NPDC002680]|uniref:NAD(P)/FAD-dependent oxidoreductase n=1 Tax=Streptomyces sp. NPDC002680 TaxID=3364659 RepID=UPI0036C56585